MGLGVTGVLVYVNEDGEQVVVSADNPLPANATRVYVSTIVSK